MIKDRHGQYGFAMITRLGRRYTVGKGAENVVLEMGIGIGKKGYRKRRNRETTYAASAAKTQATSSIAFKVPHVLEHVVSELSKAPQSPVIDTQLDVCTVICSRGNTIIRNGYLNALYSRSMKG